ncbi:MAG: ABC transporter permease, partial [Bacteroides sp.]|nr:ABC transporter permease [Bacteroides sp.]
QEDMQGTFVYHESVPGIVSKFPEIEAALRTLSMAHTKIRVGDEEFSELNLVLADSTLERFFSIEPIVGAVREALTHPGTVAISQEVAQRCFGTTNCIGRLLEIPQYEKKSFRIAAVFSLPSQSMLRADILTSLQAQAGVTCSILLRQGTDREAFRRRFEATELPTLLGKGHYRTVHSPLQMWAEEIRRTDGVEHVAFSRSGLYPMSVAVPRQEGTDKDLLMLELYENGMDFLSIYHLELLDAGQTTGMLAHIPVPVVVNEAFVRYLVPTDEAPTGQPVSKYVSGMDMDGTIVGVVKDFKKYSLTDNVSPMRMLLRDTPQQDYTTLTIKIDEKFRTAAIRRLRELWEKRYPDIPFEYKEPYRILMSSNQEVADFSRLLLMYASISLFLTLFGLFGITHYAIRQRIREIGIRKIHGASFRQILWFVNRPFIRYIGIAFVLTVPVVCYAMEGWLQQFAYRVHPEIIHFLFPLLFTVGITLFTVCLNSYRAARNNPVDSIKQE